LYSTILCIISSSTSFGNSGSSRIDLGKMREKKDDYSKLLEALNDSIECCC
jgi:hypothetical protein